MNTTAPGMEERTGPQTDPYTGGYGRFEGCPLAADDLLAILANARRRELIRLLRHRETVELEDAAELIAYLENEDLDHPDELSSEQRKRVYIGLYQDHLPTLTQHAIVEWDTQTNGPISSGRNYDVTTTALDTLKTGFDPRTPKPYGKPGVLARLTARLREWR